MIVAMADGTGATIARGQEAGPDPFTPANVPDFPPGPRPLRVAIGLTVVDFARVNSRDESFDLHGYIVARWRDPRLGPSEGGAPGRVRRLKAGAIWSPDYVFINSLENVTITNRSDLHVGPDGEARQRIDFAGKFSAALDLRRFPFDRQTLGLAFHVRNHDTSEVVLVSADDQGPVLEGAFLSDWEIGPARSQIQASSDYPNGLTFSKFHFETEIARRPAFYVWRVLIPFTLLVAVTWMVFWYDVAALQPQISTVLAIMISVVVFNFTMDFSQPKLAHLTYIDRHAVGAFGFVFAAMLAVTVLHVLVNHRGVDAARGWQRRARWAFPIAYALTIAYELFDG